MSVVEEIREQQKKALSTMTSREKLAYFWDYYKIHTLVAVILISMTVVFIHQYVTNKDYAFYATLINAEQTETNYDLATVMSEEFLTYAQIDPDEYTVYIDTSVTLSQDMSSQYAVSSQEKMLAMMQVGTVSVMVADTETFEEYAQFEYFYNLESLLTPEETEKYRPYFYYTDAASIDQGDDDTYYDVTERFDPSTLVIDHRDPSTMEKPVAVGIVLTEDNTIAQAGYYAYLKTLNTQYQGYPSDAVLGIPVTFKNPELAVRFLEFIKLGDS